MKITQYDCVRLRDGHTAYIVEILEDGKAYLADISKNCDTFTEHITINDISAIISLGSKWIEHETEEKR